MSAPLDPHRPHAATPEELVELQAIQRAGVPFVSWRDHAGALRLCPLDGGPLTIGRSAASSIAITWDPAVSSLHAEIVPVNGEWLVVDDGISTNGTSVGDRRVHGRVRLRDQDRVLVGGTLLAFHDPAGVAGATEFLEARVERTDLSANEWNVLCELCRPIVVDGSAAPASNKAIAAAAYLTLDGTKRCLTRLYTRFGVEESDSKRLELVQAATQSGLVTSRAYE